MIEVFKIIHHIIYDAKVSSQLMLNNRVHRGRHAKIFGWAKSAAYDRRYASEILRLAVLIQYRRVTDTHTQTHGDATYRASVALRGNN